MNPSQFAFRPGHHSFLRHFLLVGALSVALTLPARAVLIEFTTAEGYADGNIALQPASAPQNWRVVNGQTTDYTVDATAGVVNLAVDLNNTQTRFAGFTASQNFQATPSLETRMDFRFVQGTATVGAAASFMGLGWQNSTTSGGITGLYAFLGRAATTVDGYRLSVGANFTAVAGSLLGIDSVNSVNTSDDLRLSVVTTRTETANEFQLVLTLTNLTTNTVVATFTPPNTMDATNYADTSLFGNMLLGGGMETASLTSAAILSYMTATAVPEPSATLLPALAAGGWLFLRRRR